MSGEWATDPLNGIKVACIADQRFAGMNPIITEKINYIHTQSGGACGAYEGTNEYDMSSAWSTNPQDEANSLVGYTASLRTAVKTNPSTAYVPVVGPSLVKKESTDLLGSRLDAFVDYSNMHPYHQDIHRPMVRPARLKPP